MNADTFRDYVTWFDEQMRKIGKTKVLLVMDNAPTHQLAGLRLRVTTVAFFPANVTSICQPMDAGIIRATKARYKSKFIKHKIAAFEMGRPAHQKVNIREAVVYICEAWDEITHTTIQNCYRKAGFVKESETGNYAEELSEVLIQEEQYLDAASRDYGRMTG